MLQEGSKIKSSVEIKSIHQGTLKIFSYFFNASQYKQQVFTGMHLSIKTVTNQNR